MKFKTVMVCVTIVAGIGATNGFRDFSRDGISPFEACTDPPGIFLPIEDNCLNYGLCNKGQLIQFTCGAGNYYDKESGYCKLDTEYICNTRPERSCATEATGSSIPIAGECYKYQLCINGKPIPLECGDQQFFDDSLGYCVYDVKGVCWDLFTTTTDVPVTTTDVPVTTTDEPATTTEEPVTTTDVPVTTTDAPVTTTDEPVTTTNVPVTTTDEPATTTEVPVTTTDEPTTTTEVPVTTTDVPITTTDEPTTTTEVPVTTTDEPTTTDVPVTTTDAPVTTTDEPVTTTEIPITTTDEPTTTTEVPVTTTDEPTTTTEVPVTTTDEPTTTTEVPVTTTDEPTTTTEVPVTTTDVPITTTDEPTTTTEVPVTTTDEPTTTDVPVTTTDAPVTTTDEPVTTTEIPITTTDEPTTTTEVPVTTTDEPTTTPEVPVTTTDEPTTTTDVPVTTTDEPVTTTEIPITTTDEPTTTTEVPVTTTDEPVTTTEVPITTTDVPTTTKNDDIVNVCKGVNGTVPHEDCDKYYMCVNEVATVGICPEGDFFDQKSGTCTNDVNGVCLGRCANAPTGTRFADDSNCQWYFECKSGEEYSESCVSGYYFDGQTLACVQDVDNTCGSASPTACQDKVDGTIIAHGSCGSYYVCSNNENEVKNCDNGYRFDEQKLECVEDLKFTCFCEQNPAALFPSNQCNQYYKCDNGAASAESCPEGEYFDTLGSSCIADEMNICVAQ